MKTINTYYKDKSNLKKFIEKHENILFDQKSNVFVQVFSGLCELKYIKSVFLDIMEMIPHAHIIGTTTAGEIMNGAVSGLKTVLSFSVFQHTNIRSTLILKSSETDYQLGQSIASQLNSDKAKAMILFATGQTINVTDMLSGIQSISPTLPVAGGNAGDNSSMQKALVFNNKNVTDCGVVGAVLESNRLYVDRYWHLGWQPIGKEMTITKADNLRVYSIDNTPAYKAYQTYLGLDDISSFQNAMEYPLVINRNGITMARTPMYRYEDDSLGFLVDINEGEKVRFSYGHVGIILDKIEELCQKIKSKPVEGIFIYSCSSRRGFLHDNSEIETAPLQKIAPAAGFFTYGEYFHTNNKLQLLNGSMTVLVLSESERIDNKGLNASVSYKPNSNRNFLKKDYVADRNVGTLKALTHLVNTVTDELVEANKKLEYLGLHDALTGLYNRTYFQQEIKRFDDYEGAVGIIICDIDCLKIINDLLGHSFGDEIICMTAECLTSSCRTQDIVARIGGDEFAILVPNAEESLLIEICKRIISTVEDKRYTKLSQVLHISLGFAFKGQDGEETMLEAFKSADLNMYRKKTIEATKVQETIAKICQEVDLK